MNFYYSLKEDERRPNLLGNFNSFHHAEGEVRKLLNGSFGQFTDGYLFIHKSAVPWRSLETTYLGQFRLVRIISIRSSTRIGAVNLIAGNPLEQTTAGNYSMGWLPKAS
jgi:hypothetical protein